MIYMYLVTLPKETTKHPPSDSLNTLYLLCCQIYVTPPAETWIECYSYMERIHQVSVKKSYKREVVDDRG